MSGTLRKFFQHRVTHNVSALYLVQIFTYVLPLITYPFLARTLGPEGWGPVLFAQSLGAVIAIVVEYGFDLSATRETARNSDDRNRLRKLVTGVLGAKLTLSLLCIAICLVARPYLGQIALSPALFWGGVFWGIGQGINMLWYFQGLQRLSVAGGLDIAGRLVATASIFVFVHQQADGWKVLAAQVTGCLVAHVATVVLAYREVGFAWPSLALTKEALNMGGVMFLFRASQTLTSANGLILGLVSSPAAVSFYMASDKVTLAIRQAVWPLTQGLFPHQSKKVTEDLYGAAQIVRKSLLLIGGFAALMGAIIFAAATPIVQIALGASFLPAVPALRVLALLLPLSVVASVFCFQWMVPLGMDRQVGIAILAGGIVNVLLGIPLSIRYSYFGMAITAVIMELFIIATLNVILWRANLNPLLNMVDILERGRMATAEQEVEDLTKTAAEAETKAQPGSLLTSPCKASVSTVRNG
jgi:PST family polysaccharide transporter